MFPFLLRAKKSAIKGEFPHRHLVPKEIGSKQHNNSTSVRMWNQLWNNITRREIERERCDVSCVVWVIQFFFLFFFFVILFLLIKKGPNRTNFHSLKFCLCFGNGFPSYGSSLLNVERNRRTHSLFEAQNNPQLKQSIHIFVNIKPQFPLMEKIQEQQQQQEGAMKSRFKRICVFCGSSPGKNPSYQLAAIQLGKQLVLLLLLTLIL